MKRGFAPVIVVLAGLVLLAGLAAGVVLTQRQAYKQSQAAAAPLPSSVNLLTNGSFDEGQQGWEKTGSGKVSRGTAEAEKHTKKGYSLKLHSDGTNFGVRQKLSLPADVAYALTGYYKGVTPQIYFRVLGRNPQNVPLTLVEEDAGGGWKKVTVAERNFALSQYLTNYNDEGKTLTVELNILLAEANKDTILDDFKLAVKDDANLVQNPGFEAWKAGTKPDLYVWKETRATATKSADVPAGGGSYSLKLGVTAPKHGYVDQEVSRLLVKGADYDLAAMVKGGSGWIGVTQELLGSGIGPGPHQWLNFLPKGGGVYAADDGAAAPAGITDGQFACLDEQSAQGVPLNLKICRLYFTSKAAWSEVRRAFHVEEKAGRVWVNLVARGTANNAVYFDKTSLVYKQTAAPTAPVLKTPANGTIINDSTPTLVWQRMGGFGNSRVVKYALEVASSNSLKADGSFQTTLSRLTVNNTGQGDVQRRLSALPADGTYFWHVQALNEAGQKSPWSEIWSFVLDTKRPSKVEFTTASFSLTNNTIQNYALNVNLVWTAPTSGVDHFAYRLGYRDGASLTGDLANGGWVTVGGDSHGTGNLTFTKPALVLNKAFFAQIRAYDAVGNYSGDKSPEYILRKVGDHIELKNP